MRDAFWLTERGETRGEPESFRRTVPPELSRPGKRDVHNNALVRDVHNNALVHIYYKKHSRKDRNLNRSDNEILQRTAHCYLRHP